MSATREDNDAADAALVEWLRKAEHEPTLEPDLPICDPHHHMYMYTYHVYVYHDAPLPPDGLKR